MISAKGLNYKGKPKDVFVETYENNLAVIMTIRKNKVVADLALQNEEVLVRGKLDNLLCSCYQSLYSYLYFITKEIHRNKSISY